MVPMMLRSWLTVTENSDFPIQNLPFGMAVIDGVTHAVSRIGDSLISLRALESLGYFEGIGLAETVFQGTTLNPFMAAGSPIRKAVRERLIELLNVGSTHPFRSSEHHSIVIFPVETAQMILPAHIGDYTDFYSSREHATNVGTMFRGAEHALMPNWLHLPVGYHGRASSIVPSGTNVIRPLGQTKTDHDPGPRFGPTQALDFELEMGFYIGHGNEMGLPIPIGDADEHIFGLSLVNDWSARDIQRWEYVPLGPFLAKNFATTVSPWVVTPEALEPFRCPGPLQDPSPVAYLREEGSTRYDIQLEVLIKTPKMREAEVISRTNYRNLYWSMAQQLAHHTVGGCNLRTGDFLASGTISGSEPGSYGSLLELSWGGTKPLRLSTGEERSYLEDGDILMLRAWCQGEGYRIGFGECLGTVETPRVPI